MNPRATNQTIVCIICLLAVVISGCSAIHFGFPTGVSSQVDAARSPTAESSSPGGKEVDAANAPDPKPTASPSLSALDDRPSADKSETAQLPDIRVSSASLMQGADAEKIAQPLLDEALNYCEVSQELWQKGELENAIDALDQAYSLILTVDTADHPKLIQQKEDLRFLISRRILEIHASRNIVVNGNFHEIPVIINRHVRAEIENFTAGKEREFFVESYMRSGRYRPHIVAQLQAAGLPEQLSWLPLIESGFKPKALSRARALGLWQFIPSTGYKFGLTRDKFVDERLDPEKSTRAAIAYLKELHQIFGDWTTVLAAYNCGEGRVLRVIREQNVNYLDNFWDLYERLPYETARYVPRFLATLHIVANLSQYGFDTLPVEAPAENEIIEVNKQIHLKNIAKATDSSEKQLADLNPELRYRILPPRKYALKVPQDTGPALYANLDRIPVSQPPVPAFVYHRVRRGETLSIIARKYHTRVYSIMRANNLHSSHYIVAGRLLKIPQRGYKYSRKSVRRATVAGASAHTVKRGDSLWNIAKRYGTTTKKIQEVNNLNTTKLHIGQVLRLPGYGKTPPPDKDYRVYEVKAGDSPFTIAQQHNMALSKFLHINRLSARSTIYPGQQLYIE
jgi:membrane-bound lytic murein transglycosylase D